MRAKTARECCFVRAATMKAARLLPMRRPVQHRASRACVWRDESSYCRSIKFHPYRRHLRLLIKSVIETTPCNGFRSCAGGAGQGGGRSINGFHSEVDKKGLFLSFRLPSKCALTRASK